MSETISDTDNSPLARRVKIPLGKAENYKHRIQKYRIELSQYLKECGSTSETFRVKMEIYACEAWLLTNCGVSY